MGLFHNSYKVVIYVDDYDVVRAFYRESLGLDPEFNWDIYPGEYGICMRLGGGLLEVRKNTTAQPAPAGLGAGVFSVGSANLSACRAALAKVSGAAPGPLAASAQGLPCFALQDPTGNRMEVTGTDAGVAGAVLPKKDWFCGGLCHTLLARDMAASRQFYREALRQPPAWDKGADGCGFAIGQHHVVLVNAQAPGAPGPSMLALQANHVDLCRREVERTGIPLLQAPRDTVTGKRYFRVQDPAGNVLEVYSALEDIRDLNVGGEA